MTLTIIGDVHGKWHRLEQLLYKYHTNNIVQVGDFGIGFGYDISEEDLPSNFKFFPGNHDKKETCSNYKNYLGDFGYTNKYFFVGGALSIDKYRRQEGISWWRDEELSHIQAEECLDLYGSIKPNLVLTHDCPFVQRKLLLSHVSDESNNGSFTVKLLNEMYRIHQPKVWVHGHLHIQQTNLIGNTLFIGLKELGVVSLDEELNVIE